MGRSKPRKIGEGESFSKNVIKGSSIPVNPWNKIPRRATKFILSGWIFASNHFSREKEGRRGAAYVNPVRRCTDGQTKATPSAVWKKFHYSLIPLPPSYRCSFHLPPPPRYSTSYLHLAAPWKTDTSRGKSESYFPRCSFSESLFFFLLSSLLHRRVSLHLASPAYQNCRKTTKGEGEGLVDSLCGCGITRGQDGRRLVRILFPKCGEDRFSSSWNGRMGGDEWRKRKRGDDAM